MSDFWSKNIDKKLEERSEIVLLTMLVYGEARGESDEGKYAVACVAMNRYYDRKHRFGRTLKDVILKEKQFSCFNKKDPNYEQIIRPDYRNPIVCDVWNDCFSKALKAYIGADTDITRGATHYLTLDCRPSWRAKLFETVIIGNHVFLK